MGGEVIPERCTVRKSDIRGGGAVCRARFRRFLVGRAFLSLTSTRIPEGGKS